jgi:hypothetical protein
MDSTLESVGQDLDEACARIMEARQKLQAAPQDAPEIRQAIGTSGADRGRAGPDRGRGFWLVPRQL